MPAHTGACPRSARAAAICCWKTCRVRSCRPSGRPRRAATVEPAAPVLQPVRRRPRCASGTTAALTIAAGPRGLHRGRGSRSTQRGQRASGGSHSIVPERGRVGERIERLASVAALARRVARERGRLIAAELVHRGAAVVETVARKAHVVEMDAVERVLRAISPTTAAV